MAHWHFDLVDGRHATVKNGICEDAGERYWCGIWRDDSLLREMTAVLPDTDDRYDAEDFRAFARDLATLNHVKWMAGQPSDTDLHGFIRREGGT
jgi:hypothetical protein